MLTVVIVKNPFNIKERDIYFPEYVENKTLLEYCNEYTKSVVKLNSQDELIYSLNGKKVDTNVIPNNGDYIALCPKLGKKGLFGSILGAIAMIALAVVAPGIGKLAAAAWFGGTVAASGLITAGIMLIGGMIISALFPIKADKPNLDNNESASTYSWNKVSSNLTQGGALAVTYGTALTAGTIIYRHVEATPTMDHIIRETDGEEYLYMVLCGGQGPIDEITDIRINDLPISNYDDVEIEIRLGTNNQAPISFLNNSAYADLTLSYELTPVNEWCYATTEGNCGTGIEITLTFPQGLYKIDDEDGDMQPTYADFQVQGRVHIEGNDVRSYTDADWLPLDEFGIYVCKQSSFSISRRYGHYAPDRFDVRVRCIKKEGEGSRYANKVQWSMLSHYIEVGFVRPGKVLIGIKAKATNQLSNDIRIDWIQTRKEVSVYDPRVNAYVKKSATNPAWVCYDMIHGAREIEPGNYIVDGIDHKYIDFNAFSSWAFRCASQDLTGSEEDLAHAGSEGNVGGWGLEFNYIFSTCDDLWNALKIPEALGLGKVIIRGTKISCICDHYWDAATQLFTVANINEGSFKVEYLPLADRANAIEISYNNKAKRYQKDVVGIYESTYDNENIIKNPTQLSLDGCVDRYQALRYGAYHLNHNNYQTRTCTIDVDIDSLACTIGDLIMIQHNVPLWGYGGIIVDYDASTKKVTLDQEIKFASAEYQIYCRLTNVSAQDSKSAEILEYRKITGMESNPTNIIYISQKFSVEPQYGDVYAVGKINKAAKPFIIIAIERKSDLQATLTCIEYEPNAMNQEMQSVNKIMYSHLEDENLME